MVAAISKKTPITIGLVLLICAGCVAVSVTYMSFGSRIENLEKAIKGQIESQEKQTAIMTICASDQEAFKLELKEKTRDRWAKVNDHAFMREFCQINNLKMVPHVRIFDVSISERTNHD
jgi:hypothetical protein